MQISAKSNKKAFSYYTIFFLIGIGYIIIELILISRLSLFIGPPSHAFNTVIASMLIGSGIAGYYLDKTMDKISIQLTRKVVIAIVTFFVIAMIGQKLHTILPIKILTVRIILGSFLSGLVGFTLGHIFPLAFFKLSSHSNDMLPICWGLNGYGSVIAGPLSMLFLTISGFKITIWIIIALYVIICILSLSLDGKQVKLRNNA